MSVSRCPNCILLWNDRSITLSPGAFTASPLSGLHHVKMLDLAAVSLDFHRAALIRARQNVLELRVDYGNLGILADYAGQYGRLERLTVWVDEDVENRDSAKFDKLSLLPNLRELVLEATPSFHLVARLADVLPNLECVHFDFEESFPALHDLNAEFVAKIKSFKLYNDET